MEKITEVLKSAIKDLFDIDIEPELTRPDEQFGDFATNIALKLAGKLNKNPREIAIALASKLHGQEGLAEVNIAGPGFINIKLTDVALWNAIQTQPVKSLEGKTVVAEYSDPNPFKVLHAGHLYTTIAGDSISRLVEAAGAKVHRINYGGDVGLHVGKTMWAILKELKGTVDEKLAQLDSIPENERLDWISARYVEGNLAYDENEEAKQEIITLNQEIYSIVTIGYDKLSFAGTAYFKCREWSYRGFDILYDQLQINKFEKYIPESTVTPKGIELVQKGLDDGVFAKSDGAIIFEGEPHGLHTRVFMNSKGLPTYEAKDLGLAALKWEEYHFDLSIIITGNDIVEYMKVVLKALEHFYPEVVTRSKHFTHGMVKLPGGVKMSSRKGNILRARDILDQTREAIKDSGREVKDETVLAAVKYAFLKHRIGADIVYDPKESVALEGNSGPYLQYAHARARSIIAKKTPSEQNFNDVEFDESERSLIRKLSEYAETVEKATNELMPHHIANYLYELSQVFNRFYEKSRVIGDERQDVRLKLVESYATALRNGLGLLGIVAPDKM